jgi:choline-sulfatase
MDPHSRRVYHVCDLGRYRQTEERVKNARHAYYAAISYVDDKVGHILRALEATGFAEETVVVFTSDHGEMLGERGLWYKMNFFEWATRVPLIVWAPSRFAPRRVGGHVSLVDILPTMVEMGAGDGPAPDLADAVDGQSLVPLLQGDADSRDDPVLGEILCESAVAPCFMIRRGQYKYIYSQPDPEQLYGLESDPHELQNLAGQAEYDDQRRGFFEEVTGRWDIDAIHHDVLASQRRRRLVAHSLALGRTTPWDFQPFWDASQQYMRNHMELDDLERRARYPMPGIPQPDNWSQDQGGTLPA